MNKRIIALIGPMAAGKTTIGKRLGQDLGLPFYDSDIVIAERCQQSVSEIFATQGEAYFRHQESQVIAELCRQSDIILATGGGAIQFVGNRTALTQHCWVVYLKISLAAQLARTAGDFTRPLLQVPDKQEKLGELQSIREPLYTSIAHHTIEVSELSPGEVCANILRNIQAR